MKMHNIKPGQYKSHDKSQKATETSQNPQKERITKTKKERNPFGFAREKT